jgi:protoporphyrinogen/coproporphyrinogen III oxidase
VSRRIAVIGGGITGLAAAYRLKVLAETKSLPIQPLLLEASPRAGGIVATTSREGFLLEHGPDCFLSEKPRGVGLCRELGLGDQLIGTRTEHRRSFILSSNRLQPIPEGFYLLGPSKVLPFLSSPLMSVGGKLRAMIEPLIPSRNAEDDESLASFVKRRFGHEMLERFAQPLVGGIYAADPETLSLQATFPQFLEMERKEGSVLRGLRKRSQATREASGARYSLFVSLRHGMQTLTDTLVKALGPTLVKTNAKVASIESKGDSWQIRLADGEVITADGLCLALPAGPAAALLRPLSATLADGLASIPYNDSATIQFAFREMDVTHPLDGFGLVVPHTEASTVMAATFAHRKFEGRAPKGFVLIRAFLGGALQKQLLLEKDETLKEKTLVDLRRWLGVKAPPLFYQVERYPSSMPQYTLGHTARIKDIEARAAQIPGLVLAGNWSHGVGLPDAIASGESAAETLANTSGTFLRF